MQAILFAMPTEVPAALQGGQALPNPPSLPLWQLECGLVVCVGGVGKVNTALAAQYLMDRFPLTRLWNAGVAGAFHPLPTGTLVSACACVQHDMEVFGLPPGQVPRLEGVYLPCIQGEETAAKLQAAGLDCQVGIVSSGDWFGRDVARAARIRDQFQAAVCDMEAAAAAQVCLRSAVPFSSLKVVSDHLFHPSQHQEHRANFHAAVETLSQALAVLL